MSSRTIRIKKTEPVGVNRSSRLLLTVFMLIFVSNDTFMFGSNSVSIMVEIPRILMGVYIVYELARLLATRAKMKDVFIVALVMAALMVLISLYHGDAIKLIVIKCLCIISSVLLTLHYDFDEYAEAFSKVNVFLCVMALILECAAYILPGLVSALPRVINTANLEITTIGFAGVDMNGLTNNVIRAFGIFWEPGVFQMYLNLALIFELFNKKQVNWRRVVILSLGVLITFSTTGLVVTAWIFAAYFFLERKEKTSASGLATVGLILLGLMAVLFVFDFSEISELVFGKLGDAENGSWIARAASVFVNLDIFFDYPLFGVGMDQINAEMVRRSAEMFVRATRHNTNTLLYQFAAHGIFYGGLFALGTIKFSRCLSNKKTVMAAIAIALILLYVGENLRYSMFPFILIFYGYQAKKPVNTAL